VTCSVPHCVTGYFYTLRVATVAALSCLLYSQNELLDEVQDYLLQTVTVTAENGDALRSRCQRLRDASLNALATARTKHSQAATTAHTTMAEVKSM